MADLHYPLQVCSRCCRIQQRNQRLRERRAVEARQRDIQANEVERGPPYPLNVQHLHIGMRKLRGVASGPKHSATYEGGRQGRAQRGYVQRRYICVLQVRAL